MYNNDIRWKIHQIILLYDLNILSTSFTFDLNIQHQYCEYDSWEWKDHTPTSDINRIVQRKLSLLEYFFIFSFHDWLHHKLADLREKCIEIAHLFIFNSFIFIITPVTSPIIAVIIIVCQYCERSSIEKSEKEREISINFKFFLNQINYSLSFHFSLFSFLFTLLTAHVDETALILHSWELWKRLFLSSNRKKMKILGNIIYVYELLMKFCDAIHFSLFKEPRSWKLFFDENYLF